MDLPKDLPKLIVFASGGKTGGGSGFENLVLATQTGVLKAKIVAVVSNWKKGGVFERAKRLGVPFHFMGKPYDAEQYKKIVRGYGAEWISLSGWLKPVKGLPTEKTINIHPCILPKYGGPGMYGHHTHEAIMADFHQGKVYHSEVCMHFVTAEYDEGPVFFRTPVPIYPADTPETLGKRVNQAEHQWQPFITDLVVNGLIRWENNRLIVPDWYYLHWRQPAAE